MSREISYLVGFLCGDGLVKQYNNRYYIDITSKSIDELYYLRRLFFKNFKVKSKSNICKKTNKKRNNYIFYTLQIRDKNLFNKLSEIGIYGTRAWRITDIIKKLDLKIKASWLAGFYDAEGSLSQCKDNDGYIFFKNRVASINMEGLEDVQKLLREFNININVVQEKTCYSLNIYRKNHHKIFKKNISCYMQKLKYKNYFIT